MSKQLCPFFKENCKEFQCALWVKTKKACVLIGLAESLSFIADTEWLMFSKPETCQMVSDYEENVS